MSDQKDPLAPLMTRRIVMRSVVEAATDDDRSVTVTCSTETMGRDKIVLVTAGVDLTNYRRNPIWLYQHNPDWPVARSEQIGPAGELLVARVKFPDAGISRRADEVLGLIRAGIINTASTGFEKIKAEPIDPANPGAGTRIVSCELAEMSFVSIPALPDALVTERAAPGAEEIRGMVDTALRQRADDQSAADRCAKLKRGLIKRGLYEVGHLAYLLDELGWIKSSSEWEADVENDGSTVPAQLGEALKLVGEALISMTKEEVAELVGGGEAPDEVPEPDDAAEIEIITNARTPALARFRIGAHRAAMPEPRKPVAAPVRRAAIFHHRMAALYGRDLTTV